MNEQQLPDTVIATLLDRLTHIEIMIAGMNSDIEERKASIDRLTKEYIEISKFIGAPGIKPNSPITEAYSDIIEKHKTIDQVQKEAKACGMSYGKLQQSKKETATIKKTLKESGKWES